MNLNELKTLKEKAQGLVDTFEKDRQLLQETKAQVIADNTADFQEFLDSLTEYAALIDGMPLRAQTNCYYLFRHFGDGNTYVYDDDSYCGIWDNQIVIYNHGVKVNTNIFIKKDKAVFEWYTSLEFNGKNRYMAFILEHKAEIKACVERTVELALENYVQHNKKLNDQLCADIENLKQGENDERSKN